MIYWWVLSLGSMFRASWLSGCIWSCQSGGLCWKGTQHLPWARLWRLCLPVDERRKPNTDRVSVCLCGYWGLFPLFVCVCGYTENFYLNLNRDGSRFLALPPLLETDSGEYTLSCKSNETLSTMSVSLHVAMSKQQLSNVELGRLSTSHEIVWYC